jgi:enoyl-CoA hydratase/carnithine racemase
VDYEESTFAWYDGPAVEMDPGALQRLRFELDGGVATVTFARPERRNAIDHRTLDELTRALHHCDRSDDVRVVVLTGEGAVFSAGSELSDDGFGGEHVEGGTQLPWLSPYQVRKPVVAALNGHAVGAGLTLALQCDIRFVARDAVLALPFVRLGVVAEWMGHWTAVRHLGVARAAELLMTGRRFSGQEAAEWGLANRALDAGDVLPAALELAAEIAAVAAPVSVAITKRLIWEAATAQQQAAGRDERLLLEQLLSAADAREGLSAYLGKRSPMFTGRASTDLPAWPEPLSPGPPPGR